MTKIKIRGDKVNTNFYGEEIPKKKKKLHVNVCH